jgi:hypothetical protein
MDPLSEGVEVSMAAKEVEVEEVEVYMAAEVVEVSMAAKEVEVEEVEVSMAAKEVEEVEAGDSKWTKPKNWIAI